MSTAAVSGYSTTATSSTLASSTETAQQLKSEFLTMLMAELKNQDPTDPVDTKDLLTQQAQLSELEQMQNLNTNLVTMMAMQSVDQAVNLVGKTVTGTVDSASVSGVVSSVSFDSSGGTTLNLTTSSGTASITLAEVTNIAS